MPKVQAWQCPHSKKLFALEDEKAYRSHVRSELRHKRERELREKKAREFHAWFDGEIELLSTPYEIIKWVEQNYIHFVDYFGSSHWRPNKKYVIENFRPEFDLVNLRYSDSCSNSHSSPRTGETNWCGRNDGAPRGYPGFTGHIYCFSNTAKYYADTDILEKMRICTGTGSGGKVGQYGVTVWLDDWPGLKRNIEAQKKEWNRNEVVNRLRGVKTPKFQPDIGPESAKKDWWPDW
jgi:hypothetical protein